MPSLTQLAHEIAAGVLRPGDFAVDATAGNGHDTEFLAQAVGAWGRVVAFDVQETALAATRKRLEARGLDRRVALVLAGHEAMAEHLPQDWRGKVGAVFFNLGYLPGGDRGKVTRGETTLRALDAAVAWLRAEGLLSVVVYPGHPGGTEEAQAVRRWLAGVGRVEIFGDSEQDAHPWMFVMRPL
jgi:SAM-dependent methyltransferase